MIKLFAKKHNISVILVGHVTKDGQIAGPRIIEHMVDTVIYFESERGYQFRILRTIKNRYGATNEIGVFEMTGIGLQQNPNPSSLFLSKRNPPASGCAIFAAIEGSRPLLIEMQALIAPSSLGTARRNVVGWDQSRLAMILAVLNARCNISFFGKDIYLNIAGGLRISEPAADLAVVAALVSAQKNIPLAKGTVVFGEISLSGDLIITTQAENRLKEAKKMGFNTIYVPSRVKMTYTSGMIIHRIDTVKEFINVILKDNIKN